MRKTAIPPFTSVNCKKTIPRRYHPSKQKRYHPLPLLHKKNETTCQKQNDTDTKNDKTLTKGDERNIGVKVIPTDYQRKRGREMMREEGFTFRCIDF